MGIQTSVVGPIPERGLIVSNHLSYLDILVFGATAPCAFVSKTEVQSWPLVGWIASMTGTVYVDRSSRSETDRVRPQMIERLRQGSRLILFPEATSSDGRELLPFRSSLFQAAVDAAAPVTPAHISYELIAGDGDPATDVCYWGEMTMFPHVIRLLTKAGVLATVRFAAGSSIFNSRKQAALEMQRKVENLANAPRQALKPDRNASPEMAVS